MAEFIRVPNQLLGVLVAVALIFSPIEAQSSSTPANELFVSAILLHRQAGDLPPEERKAKLREVRDLFDRILLEHPDSDPAEQIRTNPAPAGVVLADLPKSEQRVSQVDPATDTPFSDHESPAGHANSTAMIEPQTASGNSRSSAVLDPAEKDTEEPLRRFQERYADDFSALRRELGWGATEELAAAAMDAFAEYGLVETASALSTGDFWGLISFARAYNLDQIPTEVGIQVIAAEIATRALDIYATQTGAVVDSERLVQLASPPAHFITAAASGASAAGPAISAGVVAGFEAHYAARASYSEDERFEEVSEHLVLADALRQIAADLERSELPGKAERVRDRADEIVELAAQGARGVFKGSDGPVVAQMLREMDRVVQLLRVGEQQKAQDLFDEIHMSAKDNAPGFFSLSTNNAYERYFMLGPQNRGDSLRAFDQLARILHAIFDEPSATEQAAPGRARADDRTVDASAQEERQVGPGLLGPWIVQTEPDLTLNVGEQSRGFAVSADGKASFQGRPLFGGYHAQYLDEQHLAVFVNAPEDRAIAIFMMDPPFSGVRYGIVDLTGGKILNDTAMPAWRYGPTDDVIWDPSGRYAAIRMPMAEYSTGLGMFELETGRYATVPDREFDANALDSWLADSLETRPEGLVAVKVAQEKLDEYGTPMPLNGVTPESRIIDLAAVFDTQEAGSKTSFAYPSSNDAVVRSEFSSAADGVLSPLGGVSLTLSARYFDPDYPASWNPHAQHIGIDLPAPEGTVIRSPVKGTVVINHTDRSDNFNKYLIVRDSESEQEHVFGHIDSDLAENAEVGTGSKLGTIVSAGTGPHLHWGINSRSILDSFGDGWGFGRAPLSATRSDAQSRGWVDPERWFKARAKSTSTREPPIEEAAEPSQVALFEALPDGLYSNDAEICSHQEDSVVETLDRDFRLLARPSLSTFDKTCDIMSASEGNNAVKITMSCNAEGVVHERVSRWQVSGSQSFIDLGASDGPKEFRLCEDMMVPGGDGLAWDARIVVSEEIGIFNRTYGDLISPMDELRAAGVSEDAIAFSRAFHEDSGAGKPGEFVAVNFTELGAVDLIGLSPAYTPNTPLPMYRHALAGQDGTVRRLALPVEMNRDLERYATDRTSRRVLAGQPDPWIVDYSVVGHRDLPTGGQRFVLQGPVSGSCRVCEWIGFAIAYIDVDERGTPVATEVVGILPASAMPEEDISPTEIVTRPELQQYALNMAGYDAGPMDGAVGPRTRQAIGAFQRDHCLTVTSNLTGPVARALARSNPLTPPACAASSPDQKMPASALPEDEIASAERVPEQAVSIETATAQDLARQLARFGGQPVSTRVMPRGTLLTPAEHPGGLAEPGCSFAPAGVDPYLIPRIAGGVEGVGGSLVRRDSTKPAQDLTGLLAADPLSTVPELTRDAALVHLRSLVGGVMVMPEIGEESLKFTADCNMAELLAQLRLIVERPEAQIVPSDIERLDALFDDFNPLSRDLGLIEQGLRRLSLAYDLGLSQIDWQITGLRRYDHTLVPAAPRVELHKVSLQPAPKHNGLAEPLSNRVVLERNSVIEVIGIFEDGSTAEVQFRLNAVAGESVSPVTMLRADDLSLDPEFHLFFVENGRKARRLVRDFEAGVLTALYRRYDDGWRLWSVR